MLENTGLSFDSLCVSVQYIKMKATLITILLVSIAIVSTQGHEEFNGRAGAGIKSRSRPGYAHRGYYYGKRSADAEATLSDETAYESTRGAYTGNRGYGYYGYGGEYGYGGYRAGYAPAPAPARSNQEQLDGGIYPILYPKMVSRF